MVEVMLQMRQVGSARVYWDAEKCVVKGRHYGLGEGGSETLFADDPDNFVRVADDYDVSVYGVPEPCVIDHICDVILAGVTRARVTWYGRTDDILPRHRAVGFGLETLETLRSPPKARRRKAG